MLEHYEIIELEEKWKKYKDDSKKFKFDNFKVDKFKSLKFDKTILLLLFLISMTIGAILWIVSPKAKILDDVENKVTFSEKNEIPNKESFTTKTDLIFQESNINSAIENSRGSLAYNDIGINSSVDAGGFTIQNSYQPTQTPVNSTIPPVASVEAFSSIPKDEIIDFGNPPSAPRGVPEVKSSSSGGSSGKVTIKTTPLKVTDGNLEEKFYSTNDIAYSLKLSQNAYNKKNYNDAIKWALISNELDKNNAQSWILFAKATYKKGNKQDALIALRNFDARVPSAEVKAAISQIENGAL